MKKILITGVSGFIGTHLAKYLQKKYQVIGIDKVLPDKPIQFVEYYQEDINDKPAFRNRVYAVIHLAAKAGVRESQKKFDEYVHDNILGTKSVLDNCVKYWKPKKILVASSSSVYGDGESLPMREDNHRQPKSLYAMSKCATEDICASYRNSGLLTCPICCMRIFTVFGPNQRDGLAIGNFIDAMLRGEYMTIYGDGNQSRDFTYVLDLCKMIDRLLDKNTLHSVLNMGLGITYSLHDIIYKLAVITKCPILKTHIPRDPQDAMQTWSDTMYLDYYIEGITPTPIDKALEAQVDEARRNINDEYLWHGETPPWRNVEKYAISC